MSKIGLSVPMIFNENFLGKVQELLSSKDDNIFIDNFYGAPSNLTLGHSRVSKKIPMLTKQELKGYINDIHSLGVKFNLTLNNIWNNGIERIYEKEILKEVADFIDMGVDSFILGNLYLADLIRSNYKDVNITASINLKTDSSYKIASYLKDFDFQKIVLDRTLNRNIKFLRGALKNYANNIVLLANPDCLFDCPLSLYHMLEAGKTLEDRESYSRNNYCVSFCKKKFTDYSNILKTSWIHPNDLDLYRNINLKFIKIQGRTLGLDRLINILNYYLNYSQQSNLSILHIFPNFIGKDKFIKKNQIIFDKYDRRLFIESFFKENINCKTDCMLSCFKCTEYLSF